MSGSSGVVQSRRCRCNIGSIIMYLPDHADALRPVSLDEAVADLQKLWAVHELEPHHRPVAGAEERMVHRQDLRASADLVDM